MAAIKCNLLVHSLSAHLQQLYTGFFMLHNKGVVRVSQQLRQNKPTYASDARHLIDAGHAHVTAIVDSGLRLHFDTHDAKEIAIEELEACDFYFKRSYSPTYLETLSSRLTSRIFPLGFNYKVLPDVIDSMAIVRALRARVRMRERITALKEALDVNSHFGFHPRCADMQATPDHSAPPRVLFLAAAYDPYDDPTRSPDKIADRLSINETRASCIRLLRSELGSNFVGGFIRNRYSMDRYGELVVPSAWTRHRAYIETLKSFPICIATTGLHGSVGWKLAEYVAFSKAIVSEKLQYEAPGDFEPGRNYLEFTSPEQCLAATRDLIADTNLRNVIMRNNAGYYQRYLRPDSLVLNALQIALK